MNKKVNKLVTNYPVNLTEEEIENLSATLAPVVAACGGGGGGTGGKIYTGMDFVNVNNSTNQIGLTEAAKTKLNQDIPTKVSDLSDSANYQTVAGMNEYLTTGDAQNTYLTKSDAENGYAPIGTYTDVQTLKNQIQNVYTKSETSASDELSTEFDSLSAKYQEKGSYASQQSVQTLTLQVQNKQDKLTYGYDENNAISSIDGTALAGQGGTTYTPGQYINIDSNNEISVTGLVAADEYATYSGDWNDVSNSYKTNSGSFLTSEALTNYATKTYVDGKDPVLIGDSNITAASSTVGGHTQWNLAVNATPVVTDTKLVGDNCVTAHTTQTSGEWIVGLEQTAYEAIGSVGGISTDVTTLKNASANWNKVSDKLDTTAAAQTYLEKATYASDSATFALKTQLDDYYEKTNTSSKTELSTEFAKYQVTGDYVTQSDISDMATQTWVGEQGFYTKASGDNDYAPKSVTATINTLTGASAGWNNKVDKPSSLNDKYLVLRTDNAGNVSGWEDLKNECYSKTEATGTFVATANIDTTTLSGDGKTVSTKLGVKTDVIATKDYVNDNFLPLSGGTVSGLTTISGIDFDNTLEIKRSGQANNYAHIGLNNSRGLSFKAFDDNASNNVQFDMLPNNSNSSLIRVQHNDSQVGFLIPAVTATTTAGLTNDGILHIILES